MAPFFVIFYSMAKWVEVDFDKCVPGKCSLSGASPAAGTCTHGLLEQEEPGDHPMLLFAKLCVGCGDCARACPLKAIELKSGLL